MLKFLEMVVDIKWSNGGFIRSPYIVFDEWIIQVPALVIKIKDFGYEGATL